MNRRAFVTGLGAVFAAPLAAEAQRIGKVYTIGILSSAAPSPTLRPVLFNTLRDLGYEVGRNLVIERRDAAGKLDALPHLAADLVRRNPDIIIAVGTSESLAAAKATATIPIVFMSAAPIELGLVTGLARPGGNVTGVSTNVTTEVVGKLLEFLKTMVPRLSRFAVFADPERPESRIYERATNEAAQRLRVEVRMGAIHREGDFDTAFAELAANRPDALGLRGDPLVMLNLKRITDFATAHRLPTIAYVRTFVDEGSLMSYGPNFGDLLRRVAVYVDKILKGANPAKLPIEQPTKFELVINLKTAKALGLIIPPSLLLRADQVIE